MILQGDTRARAYVTNSDSCVTSDNLRARKPRGSLVSG